MPALWERDGGEAQNGEPLQTGGREDGGPLPKRGQKHRGPLHTVRYPLDNGWRFYEHKKEFGILSVVKKVYVHCLCSILFFTVEENETCKLLLKETKLLYMYFLTFGF